ncbi:abc transporter [Colletotrichum incanum]|uniref:Abc transporter n=1 Tax=Colletotrichum incanum TaxID=1573173 RepID=A0A167BSA9_COLIC|nr:abc transporter [Colletotrichum incanum]OHX00069.1 ABC multidrug transporter [Colletotrichum incanum]
MSSLLPPQECPDQSFGPWAGATCRGGLDFTLMFEETILTIPLQCIFLLVLPLRLGQLYYMSRKTVPNNQSLVKVAVALSVFGCSTALLVLWASGSAKLKTEATIPAAALVLAASLAFCLLTWLEHNRNIKPSFIPFAYLFLCVLLDLPRCRTLWMSEPAATAPALFTVSLALRFLMLAHESAGKRRILLPDYRAYAKSATASTLSRSTFFWLRSLFIGGYKRNIALRDLDPLEPGLESEPLYRSYRNAWEKVPDKTAGGVLYLTWLKVFVRQVMAAFIPKLCQIGFTYTQPFLIELGIGLAALPQGGAANNAGYGLIGAYAIVYTGIAISTGQYEWRAYRAATVMRGSIIGLVYQKSLRLDTTVPDVSPEGALTLVTTDIENITQGVVYLHDIWGAFVEMAVGIYLIYRQLGSACAMPVAIVFVVLVVVAMISIPIGKSQANWVRASQDRVTTTSKVLGSIKSLKISGLSDFVFSLIRDLRTKELQVSERYRKLLGATLVLMICIPIWSPILTFCVFAAQNSSTLNIQRAFTAYSLLTLVNRPLGDIILALPILAGSVTSFQRIQDYLNGKEQRDNRLPMREESSSGSTETEKPASNGHSVVTEKLESQGISPSQVAAARLDDKAVASLQGKFAWESGSEPVIDISDMRIRAKTFTLILGPVGCGKSTLLKALLGELSGFKGTIRTNYSRVGYCDQNAWLPNDTVSNIILGRADFDESWYRKVIAACGLEQDFNDWPKGEGTVVGTMGISMSGGQRHRLSLARAVYSRAEVLILDDPFSGLDSETEDLIFHNLLGEQGLLRLADMTIIFASSDVRRVPYADQIMLLSEKGQISEVGTPAELSSKLETRQAEMKGTGHHGSESGAQSTQRSGERAPPSEAVVVDMEYQAQTARRLGDSAVYGFYARSAGWLPLVSFVLSMVVFAFCSSFPNIWLKWWAEDADPGSNLGKWLGVYVALGVGSVSAVMLGAWQLFVNIINNSGTHFHSLLADTTSRAPLSFHVATDSGVTVNRFSQDLQLIDMELPSTALGLAVGVAFGCAEFVMIAVASRYIAILLPFLMLCFYAIQHFYLRTSRQIRLLDIEYKAPLYSQLIKTIDGLVTIRAFGWQDEFEEKNMDLLNTSQRPSYLLYCIQRWLTFSVDMMIALIALVLIVVTTTLREQIGPGYMGIALSNILSFSGTIKAALTSWVTLEIAISAVARIRDFSITTEREADPEEELTKPSDQDWPGQGAIDLRGVTASYPSSGTILHDVTLSIKPGEKVAICGRSGSGKSSLVLCILRLMQLESGTITIDGVDLSTVPHEHVRSRLTAVPQDVFIFDGTVRLNVDPEKTATDEDIKKALENVRLWSKVEQRGGLDATIHDKFFSRGESQLLVFARAMLQKSKVLVLDEFTSSLDDETAAIIYGLLKESFDGWTVIAIAHKLEPVLEFDRVAVLSSGRVIEYDEPKKLVEQDDSAFKRLFELSARSAE